MYNSFMVIYTCILPCTREMIILCFMTMLFMHDMFSLRYHACTWTVLKLFCFAHYKCFRWKTCRSRFFFTLLTIFIWIQSKMYSIKLLHKCAFMIWYIFNPCMPTFVWIIFWEVRILLTFWGQAKLLQLNIAFYRE